MPFSIAIPSNAIAIAIAFNAIFQCHFHPMPCQMPLMPFNAIFKAIMLSIIYLLLLSRHSPLALTTQCNCYFTHFLFQNHTPHFSLQLVNEIAQNEQFPVPLVYSYTTFLSAHPSVHFALKHFPSTFFTLCLLTTQTKLHVSNT